MRRYRRALQIRNRGANTPLGCPDEASKRSMQISYDATRSRASRDETPVRHVGRSKLSSHASPSRALRHETPMRRHRRAVPIGNCGANDLLGCPDEASERSAQISYDATPSRLPRNETPMRHRDGSKFSPHAALSPVLRNETLMRRHRQALPISNGGPIYASAARTNPTKRAVLISHDATPSHTLRNETPARRHFSSKLSSHAAPSHVLRNETPMRRRCLSAAQLIPPLPHARETLYRRQPTAPPNKEVA